MPAERKKCPGCLKLFISQRAHLTQTSNPLCKHLLAKKKRSSHPRPGPTRVSPRSPSQQQDTQPLPTPYDPPPVLTDSESSPQEGDGQLPSHNPLHAPSNEDEWDDEESDDEDEDLDSTSESLRPGWEPPVLNGTDNMSVSSDDADSGPPPPYVPPEGLRERTWVEPKVVKFPSPRAGEPVRSADSTNNTYDTLLGNHSNLNPYHPFASKLDWEVAKWAKLRGPSSTSLMDLLKIEGVISFVPIIYQWVF